MTVPQHCGSGRLICRRCSGYCSRRCLSSSPSAAIVVIVVLVAALRSASSASLRLSLWQSFTRGRRHCSHNCCNRSWPSSLLRRCPGHHRCGHLASALVDVLEGGAVRRRIGVTTVGFACHRLRAGG
jgi:hypothetical protein